MCANMLTDANRSGLYSLTRAQRIAMEKCAPANFCRLHADLGACADTANLLAKLGEALNFPDWYGKNFDALNDCLTDPDWQPAAGHLLFLDGLASLRHGDPEGFGTLIEVLQAAAKAHRTAGHPFWLLFDTPARGVPKLPSA